MTRYKVKKLENRKVVVTYEIDATNPERAAQGIEEGEGEEIDEEYVEREEIRTLEVEEVSGS